MAWCEDCQKEVDPVAEDQGYGRGEFWGVPYNHVEMVLVCPNCDGAVDQSYAAWKYENDCNYADYKYDEMKDREFDEQ